MVAEEEAPVKEGAASEKPDTPGKRPTESAAEEPKAETTPAPTPKKSAGRPRRAPAEKAKARTGKAKEEGPKAPRRPTLDPEVKRLLGERRSQDARRPKFVRQQSHRYFALGRRGSWRRPRGQQSKQRRHYGYRPTVVSIGFGSPRATRHLTPSGFRPVLIHSVGELEGLDATREAIVIARTVGTRKRLVLEERARRKGIHVLNPLLHERGES
jgi:large subunit ribosomal protein L32e